MRRVIAVAIAGASLAGCSSFSWDMFKSAPASIPVQLESNPPGADARTSLGPSCKTPCSVSAPAPDTGFSVTYTLDKFQSQTVQVQVVHNPGDASNPATTVTEPNPVFAELQPAAPPPKARKPLRPSRLRTRRSPIRPLRRQHPPRPAADGLLAAHHG
jgi:hypothetical protein